jgi:hypothetical protein
MAGVISVVWAQSDYSKVQLTCQKTKARLPIQRRNCMTGNTIRRVDVFSFGLVPHEILVGRAVCAGLSEERTVYPVMEGSRTELAREMSSDVKSLIARCWAGDANRRPSFSDVRKDFERVEFNILPVVDTAALK